MAIWSPMHWLPDDTILFAQAADDPGNGLWRVGIEGADPLLLTPGGEDIPGLVIDDVDAGIGMAAVHSSLRLAASSTTWSEPAFWTVDLTDGAAEPLPFVDLDTGANVAAHDAVDAGADEAMAFPAGPASFAPDASAGMLLYRSLGGEERLGMLDVTTGDVGLYQLPGPETQFSPVVPQWADNQTVFLTYTSRGQVLLIFSHRG